MKKELEMDAFASGQIGSKIWLCEELEKLDLPEPLIIWILGGWYGLTSFVLMNRGNVDVQLVRSFDIDPEVEKKADLVNENWHWKDWKFKAFTHDANLLEYRQHEDYGPEPNLVINTSTEHFYDNIWYERIPEGTLVALQSNDMPHPDHHQTVSSLDEFKSKFNLHKLKYSGQIKFEYPDWSFNRFMLIGEK